ncbi:hypothetical protein Pmani_031442 [Petrolisthes manimaculis]|uniref:Ig-like domain-containing protein n=1 Tax=Petrolisthes manimaculis TaxID=1843537 RepID=A0AAE1NTT2_9EUCA|nr:hypothetical protein Pmani_031442 [Petrolisthes manimaculis]
MAPPSPGTLTWLHNHTPLLPDGTRHKPNCYPSTYCRGGLNVEVEVDEGRATSRLTLTDVLAKDAGNYTCQPQSREAAHITVFVLRGESWGQRP